MIRPIYSESPHGGSFQRRPRRADFSWVGADSAETCGKLTGSGTSAEDENQAQEVGSQQVGGCLGETVRQREGKTHTSLEMPSRSEWRKPAPGQRLDPVRQRSKAGGRTVWVWAEDAARTWHRLVCWAGEAFESSVRRTCRCCVESWPWTATGQALESPNQREKVGRLGVEATDFTNGLTVRHKRKRDSGRRQDSGPLPGQNLLFRKVTARLSLSITRGKTGRKSEEVRRARRGAGVSGAGSNAGAQSHGHRPPRQ